MRPVPGAALLLVPLLLATAPAAAQTLAELRTTLEAADRAPSIEADPPYQTWNLRVRVEAPGPGACLGTLLATLEATASPHVDVHVDPPELTFEFRNGTQEAPTGTPTHVLTAHVSAHARDTAPAGEAQSIRVTMQVRPESGPLCPYGAGRTAAHLTLLPPFRPGLLADLVPTTDAAALTIEVRSTANAPTIVRVELGRGDHWQPHAATIRLDGESLTTHRDRARLDMTADDLPLGWNGRIRLLQYAADDPDANPAPLQLILEVPPEHSIHAARALPAHETPPASPLALLLALPLLRRRNPGAKAF
jgi:hypothetical protein